MARILIIRNSSDLIRTIGILGRMEKNFKIKLNKYISKYGTILEREVKQSAINAGIKSHTGTLQKNGIRWEQKKKLYRGFLFIRLYGLYLDSMKPHHVNVSQRRFNLLRWALKSKNKNIRDKAGKVETKELKKFSLFVRPHPFINNGIRIANKRLDNMMKRFAKEIVNS